MSSPTLGERVLDVEKALHSLHGWRKGAMWAGGLLLLAVGWWVTSELMPALHGVQSSLSTDETRLGKIEGQLTEIHIDMLRLRVQGSPKAVFEEITKLQPTEFVKALPTLRQVTEQPASKLNLSQPALRNVASKLLEIDPNTPDYWPTVLQFIEFASTGLSPDVPPPGPPNWTISNNQGFGLSVNISHRIVLLDGGDLGSSHFSNSRIRFTEHPVHMKNVVFTDCVFELPVSTTPNQYLQDASRVLLASELNSATIPKL